MLTRRDLLKAIGAAGLGTMVPPGLFRSQGAGLLAQELPTGVVFDPAPFTLGVASGYPTQDSVVLWTRIAPEPLAADGGVTDPVEVRWAVGETREAVAAELERHDAWSAPSSPNGGPLRSLVAAGTAVAAPESGHSVHVDVTGLQPGGTYYYGFAASGGTSEIGRTRTTPAGPTDHLRFAVASCQDFSHGLWPAHRHIADEDVDFVLHAGDYIYEHGGRSFREHIGGTLTTPADFRIRHALYKGDPNLRRAHAMHPWILIWDDHEIRNNYAGPHRPANVDQLRTGGYKAYYEHLPIRLTEEGPPNGPWFRIYQSAAFGDLLDVALTDTRQYRDVQPCRGEDLPCFETHAYTHGRTILGEAQKGWLKDLLASSTAAWRVLATSVPFTQWEIGGAPHEVDNTLASLGTPVNDKVYFNEDTWDNYAQERHELLQFMHDRDISNVVSLSGESHRHIWSHIYLDVDNPVSPIVMPEFGGTAISSNSGATNENDNRMAVYATSNHIRYLDSDHWGYMVCDVTKDRWRTTARTIQHSQDPALDARRDPDATVFDDVVFEITNGDPTMRQIAGENGNPLPG